MPVSNFGGLAPDLPVYGNLGLRTVFGMLLPPGARLAAYVRSTGLQDGDDTQIATNLVSTLNAGLARCRSGKNDVVMCLPGHAENFTDGTAMSNLVAGTRIIGIGQGSNMPILRATAAASQLVFNKADVTMAGMHLKLEGFNGITKAVAMTGADNVLYGNDIEVASGAALKSTIAIELATGADRSQIVGNVFRGTNTHNVTNGLLISNALDALKIAFNDMLFSATAANGCINVNAAATNLRINNNAIYNTMTASTAALNFAAAASDGVCWENYVGILTNGAAVSTGIVCGAGVLVKFLENYVTDEPQKSGILNPAAAT